MSCFFSPGFDPNVARHNSQGKTEAVGQPCTFPFIEPSLRWPPDTCYLQCEHQTPLSMIPTLNSGIEQWHRQNDRFEKVQNDYRLDRHPHPILATFLVSHQLGGGRG